ncbi:biotin/lipoyl-containing protein [Nocardiopsis sp. FIRDI 009]|uniref:biotin/lipoyl-containing protein n=1 Tax=Nocardiopsis sp. FIRDI 009 TaxID=714197 RepID=UPI000E249BD0|nr:biotin/lipoyl-containing protein [Nocardiopsis sp. FIRDI 009]
MGRRYFRLPDVGEGLTEAEILRWLVASGDRVDVNQPVVEVETAKSAVELPCPFTGVVTELLVEEGTVAAVGTALISVEVGDGPDDDGGAEAPMLVGHGARRHRPTRRRRRRPQGGGQDAEREGG